MEIVARPRTLRLVIGARPIIERRRVCGTPQDGVGLGIVSARHPAAAPARSPRIVAPRLHGLVGAADRQEFPLLLPGGCIQSEDGATARPFTALRSDDHRP